MIRSDSNRRIIRWTGIGLCTAILASWLIFKLVIQVEVPEPPETMRAQPGSVDGLTYYHDLLLNDFLPVLTIAAMLLFILGFKPVHRKKASHCRKCKYPLVGITSGRCPECGTIIPTFRPSTTAHHEADPSPQSRPQP